jgi:hypothetical protein
MSGHRFLNFYYAQIMYCDIPNSSLLIPNFLNTNSEKADRRERRQRMDEKVAKQYQSVI